MKETIVQFVEQKKTRWQRATEIAIFIACVISTAWGIHVYLDNDATKNKVIELERQYQELLVNVHDDNAARIEWEGATQNKVSTLSGEWKGSGKVSEALLLAEFVKAQRQELKSILKTRGIKL